MSRDPDLNGDEPQEEVIQYYYFSAGRTVVFLLAFVAAAALFSILNFADRLSRSLDNPESGSPEYDIVGLSTAAAIFIGLLVAWWIWHDLFKKIETGSRIDLRQRKIFWWNGPAPRVENVIDIDTLSRITFENNGEENEDILLWDKSGGKIILPGICVKDSRDWARAIKAEFPSIRSD